ncbi:unnamed protein product [Arctia plantaginis]|uniref:Uncharacterized protein n=1 Tax=Arctia plantaginis TaxID=874455 RepID=A0A8S1AUR7_ARCPL|nr:unnamed protein product [Arctia plantaginis]
MFTVNITHANCLQIIEILQQQYGLPQDAAVESGTNFLRAFRARPDDDTYALDEWPAHLWRNCLPKKYRHIAKNISAEWVKLRFQCLALTNDVIHLLETLRSVVAQRVSKLGALRAQHLGLNCICKIYEGVHHGEGNTRTSKNSVQQWRNFNV